MHGARGTCLIVLLMFSSVLLQGCGNSVDIASNWSASPVVLGGKSDQWTSFKRIEDANVMLGVKNDHDYLYLCLESTDQRFRQEMLGLGMTVWFAPKGGDKIGIRYPLGMAGMGPREDYGASGGEPPSGEPPAMRGPGESMQGGKNGMWEPVKELEILGPGKNDVERMPLLQAPGIEARIGQSEGGVVYELKVPLKKTRQHPYAVATTPGSKVAVNFVTGKFNERPGRSGGKSGGQGGEGGGFPGGGSGGGMGPAPGGTGPVGGGGGDGGGPMGGGMPGGGGMGGGRRGGRGGEGGMGAGRSEPKQFKLETEVTLASGPADQPAK